MKKIPRGDISLSDYYISETINIINTNYLKYKSILEKHYKDMVKVCKEPN